MPVSEQTSERIVSIAVTLEETFNDQSDPVQQLHVHFIAAGGLAGSEQAAIKQAVALTFYALDDCIGSGYVWQEPDVVNFGDCAVVYREQVPQVICQKLEALIETAGLDFAVRLDSRQPAA